MSKYLYCGDFPELQSHFITTVSALRKQAPLDAMTVLVTGQLVRISLKRELARAGCSHANIRFTTLNEIAQQLTKDEREAKQLKLLPDITRDLLMRQAVDVVSGKLSYFSRLKNREGFRRALWQMIDDLRGAKVTPPQLLALAQSPQLKSQPIQGQKFQELSWIWSSLKEIMTEHNLTDRIAILELALNLGFNFDQPLVIYGLDEFNALEFQFLEQVTAETFAMAYLPCKFENINFETISAAYRWIEPVFNWYRSQNFVISVLNIEGNDLHTTLHAIQKNIFSEFPKKSNVIQENDKSFQLLSVPSESREAEELVRELFSKSNNPKSSDKTAFLLRQNDPYVKLLRDRLQNLEITGYFHECQTLGETQTGKALGRWATLLDGAFSREGITDFLLLSMLKRPEDFPKELPVIPSAEWNDLTYRGGITKGIPSWQDGFLKLKNTLSRELKAIEQNKEEEYKEPELRRQLISLSVFENYFNRLISKIESIQSAHSWFELTEKFWNTFTELVETDSEASEAILRELEFISELNQFGIELNLLLFRQLIETLLHMPASREGKFERHEPTVATIKQAKGVIFDTILIPGLAEKRFPQAVSQDPILSDEERNSLNGYFFDETQTARIPLRSRESYKETYLYRIALTSARKRIVLSFPRLDLTKSREILPSHYLLKTLEALTGDSADYEKLKNFIHESPQGKFIPLSRLNQSQSQIAVTELDYHLSKLGAALETKSADSLSYLKANEFFNRGIVSEQSRYARKNFGRYDGLIEDYQLIEKLKTWSDKTLRSFSPSRLETYAVCPFQYFGKYVLDLEILDEPEEARQIDALQRGTIIHDILEKFYKQEFINTERSSLTSDSWARLEKIAKEIFAEFEKNEITGLYVLWQNEKQRLLSKLKKFFNEELAQAGDFVPKYFEEGFGLKGFNGSKELNHDPYELTLSNESTLSFRGRIDRIDFSKDGTVRVIDYKTGKKKEYIQNGQISEGKALQLPIYRLAAEQMTGREAPQSLYYFIFQDGKKIFYDKSNWETQETEFKRIVNQLVQGIRLGKYYPSPDEEHKCKFCEVRAACGQGRLTSKRVDPLGRED